MFGSSWQTRVRRVGAIVLLVAAVVVTVSLGPDQSNADYGADVSETLLKYEMNSSDADSAPKQTVVNGWVAKDLLEVIAREGSDRDRRPVWLMFLGVTGIVLYVGTSDQDAR